MSFVIGPYRAVEHPGAGHRAAAAGLWRGEDLRTADEVALTVLPLEWAELARSQVDAVRALLHPHLLPVIDVLDDDERVAVISPWPPGGRLRELITMRGRLTVGETLTVLIPLASALAVVHADGRLRHGGVCPDSVWFDSEGRPLLGAVAVSRIVADLSDGLPPGSGDVAPEVVRGERLRGGPVTPAADIFSLGSVALACLTGRPAWPADDPADVLVQSAAGLWPDPPDDAGPAELTELVREMLRAEPGERPDAASVAQRLAAVADPAPIRFAAGPAPVPASADRWRGWTARDKPPGASVPRPASEVSATESPPRKRRAVRNARAASSDAAEPPAGPPRRPGPLARVGIGVLCGLLLTLVVVQIGAWRGGWEDDSPSAAVNGTAVSGGTAATSVSDVAAGSSGAAVPDGAIVTSVTTVSGGTAVLDETPAPNEPPASDESAASGGTAVVDAPVAPDWSAVIRGLDAARGKALAAADPALLQDVYLGDSAANQADAATIARLAGSGWRVVDGVHEISSVTVQGSTPAQTAETEPAETAAGPSGTSAPDQPDQLRLAVVDSLPAHPIVDASGRQVGLTEARAEQRRVFDLARTGSGYRISGVESP